MISSWVKRTRRRPTGLREMGIHQSSLSQIICKDLHLKCFKRRRAQELTDANCAVRMKHAKLLLQKFPQYTTDFVFFTEKRCSQLRHLTIGRTKSVVDCRNVWRRSLAFSSVRALRGLPLPHRLLTVPVSRNFLNSLLTPRLVHFSREIRLSTSSLCTPSNTKPEAIEMQFVCFFLNIGRKFEVLISQGSVATCLRWGG